MEHLGQPAASISTSDRHCGDAARRVERVGQVRDRLATGAASEQRELLLDRVRTVELHHDHVAISLADCGVTELSACSNPAVLTVAAVRVRRSHDIRLVIAAPAPATPKRDARLVQLVADAVTTRERLQTMGDASVAQAAAWLGCSRSTLTDRIKLSFLAPGIIEAIVAGRQPRSLTRRRLAAIDLPIDWRQQRQMLGFG